MSCSSIWNANLTCFLFCRRPWVCWILSSAYREIVFCWRFQSCIPILKFKSNASAAGLCDQGFLVNKDTGGWLYRSGMVWKLFVGTSTVRQDRCWGLKSGCYFSWCTMNHTLTIQNSISHFLPKILAVWSSKLMMIYQRLRLGAAIIVFWSTQAKVDNGAGNPTNATETTCRLSRHSTWKGSYYSLLCTRPGTSSRIHP